MTAVRVEEGDGGKESHGEGPRKERNIKEGGEEKSKRRGGLGGIDAGQITRRRSTGRCLKGGKMGWSLLQKKGGNKKEEVMRLNIEQGRGRGYRVVVLYFGEKTQGGFIGAGVLRRGLGGLQPSHLWEGVLQFREKPVRNRNVNKRER